MEDNHNYKKGLYHKFDVTRVSTGEPVEDFTFVLLPRTDQFARIALFTYVVMLRQAGFDFMADQLQAKIEEAIVQSVEETARSASIKKA